MPILADADRADEIEALTIARLRQQQAAADAPAELPYADNPAGWMETRLSAFLWSKSREIAEAVRDYRRVAVHSAHELGKSWTAGRLVAWWLETHKPGEAFVVTTAPSGDQIKAILWQEIRTAHAEGRLSGRLNLTEWWLGDRLIAMGRKSSEYQPSSFQGIHARYVLVVIDEACGVAEPIFRAAASLAANEPSRILAIGNPDDPTSYFATVCKPGSGWHVIHVDGLASPNFTDAETVPEAVRTVLLSPIYERELREELGEESPVYISKIRGLFPENTTDGVVPLSWVRACQRLERDWPPDQQRPVELGMDVGAGGDETVLRERRGWVAGRTWRKRTPDWAEAVALVLDALVETGATRVKVDVVGIGWGVVGRLQELRTEGRHSAEIVPVNVGAASTALDGQGKPKFPHLRDQLWWEIGRELSRAQAWDLAAVDEVTVGQLIAPTYRRDSAGRIVVEPKVETRKRLKRSPDDADALLLAFYDPPAAARQGFW